MNDTPKCPRCGTAKHARPNGDRLWLCTKCDGLFDDSGDDGTVGYQRPDKIAERNERHEQNRKGRMKVSTDFSRFDESKLKGGPGR